MFLLVAILAVIATVLWWQKLHPYIVTREQMQTALQQVLERKMPANEWRRLIEKRIPRDRYLENLRVKLTTMYLIPGKEGDVAQYSEADAQQIKCLLDELRKKRT